MAKKAYCDVRGLQRILTYAALKPLVERPIAGDALPTNDNISIPVPADLPTNDVVWGDDLTDFGNAEVQPILMGHLYAATEEIDASFRAVPQFADLNFPIEFEPDTASSLADMLSMWCSILAAERIINRGISKQLADERKTYLQQLADNVRAMLARLNDPVNPFYPPGIDLAVRKPAPAPETYDNGVTTLGAASMEKLRTLRNGRYR